MNLTWMISAGSAAGLGVIVGGILAWRVCAGRATRRQQRTAASFRERYVAGTQGLRAKNARLQAALDLEKQAIHGRLAAAAADHRAETVRLEGQLRFAYAEIERLKAATAPPRAAPARGVDGAGFAHTRPFDR